MPASDMNRMAARWIEVPEFEDAQLISPGRALEKDASSGTGVKGADGGTPITLGVEARSATGANALSPSYGSLRSSGLMVRCEPARRMVYPSGAAGATISVPMTLLRPGVRSRMTCWPRPGPSPSATARATMSTVPPGGLGTTILNVLAGNSCAGAALESASAAIRVVTAFLIDASLGLPTAFAHRGRDTIPRIGKPPVTGGHMSRIGDRGEMEAFVRSVELGSFSAAARELRLTPSALSKLVTRLERSLKVRLLNRTPHRINPTAAGTLFFRPCRSNPPRVQYPQRYL